MRNMVMPGARIIETVVMTLTALERARRAGEDDRDDPQVAAEPRRADRPRQRRVGEPAERRRAAVGEEAEQHRHAAEQVQPVRQRVEPRERQVGRADLQRHEVVGEGEPERDGEQVHHHAAVDREHAVVRLLGDDLQPGLGELGADDAGERAADGEEHERRDGVGDADRLVVGRRQPAHQRARQPGVASPWPRRRRSASMSTRSSPPCRSAGPGGRSSVVMGGLLRPLLQPRGELVRASRCAPRSASSCGRARRTRRTRRCPGSRRSSSPMSTSNDCVWPGNMSRLKRKPGIQNEWMTSTDVRSKRTSAPVGSTSSGISVVGADHAHAGVRVVELPLPLEAGDLDGEVGVVVVDVDGVDRHERDGEQGADDRAAARRCRRSRAGCSRAAGAGSAVPRRRKRTTTNSDQADDERRRRRRAASRKPFQTRSMSSACSVSGGGQLAIVHSPHHHARPARPPRSLGLGLVGLVVAAAGVAHDAAGPLGALGARPGRPAPGTRATSRSRRSAGRAGRRTAGSS